MRTDLSITGRPAQFGRGVMVEVGNKILGKFADCLASTLADAPGDDGAAGDGHAAGDGGGAAEAAGAGHDVAAGGAADDAAADEAAQGGGAADDAAAGDSEGGSSSPTSEAPKTLDAAVEAGQEVSDRFSSGDFAGSWDLMSSEFKDGISREDYAKLSSECSGTGIPIDVEGVRLEGEDEAIVRLAIGDFTQSRTMVFEDGQWLQAPSPHFREDLGKPVEKIIEEKKAAGECTGD